MTPNESSLDFTTWTTPALVRLARILSLTKAVQTADEQKELAAVMAELSKRDKHASDWFGRSS